MSRIAPRYFPRPHPEIVNGKLVEPKVSCHICGKPGKWRARVFGWNYVNGEVVCDECEEGKQMDTLSNDEVGVLVARMLKCRKAITDKHGTKRPKTFVEGSVQCPECLTGTLHYTISNYNGHIHAQCTTEGCASWIE